MIAATALSMPRFTAIGLAPAVTFRRAFPIDRLRQHRRGRGAIAGDIRRLARHFLDHLRAHVLERVLQLDLLRDGHAVLGDGRGAELPVEDDVAPARSECDPDRIGQAVDPAKDALPRGVAVDDLLCH